MSKTKKIIKKSSLKNIIDQYQNSDLISTIESTFKKEAAISVPLEQIEFNPLTQNIFYHPKYLKEMKASVAEKGVINPILVRKVDQKYQLISGYKRLYVAKELNIDSIPVIVRDIDDDLMLYITIEHQKTNTEENILNKAYTYKAASTIYNISRSDLALLSKQSVSQIANSLRILSLEPEVIDLIKEEKISYGHVRTLVGMKRDTQIKLAQKAVTEKLSVRSLEDIVLNLKEGNPYQEQIKQFKKRYKGEIKVTNTKIKISFKNKKDLHHFLDFLNQEK